MKVSQELSILFHLRYDNNNPTGKATICVRITVTGFPRDGFYFTCAIGLEGITSMTITFLISGYVHWQAAGNGWRWLFMPSTGMQLRFSRPITSQSWQKTKRFSPSKKLNLTTILFNPDCLKHQSMRNYIHLPQRFQRKHDMCMALISQIEEFIIKDEYAALKVLHVDLPEGTEVQEDEHILTVLLRTGMKAEHDYLVKSKIITGLLSDFCYFTQEALDCSLKQRLTVTFALLRKPFVYSLIVMLRLLFEEDFIDRFNTEEKFDPAAVSPQERKALIDTSLEYMRNPPFNTDDITNWIFDKQDRNSLMNTSDQALHLSTTRNPHNLTCLQNFNYIFSTFESIESQWEYLYARLPALLLYLVEVTDMLVFTTIEVDGNVMVQRLTERAAFLTGDSE